jgi:hypothetical protein
LLKLNGEVTHSAAFVKADEYNSQHYTVVFNLFIFMQIFNLLNCRKIDQYNFFDGIHKNLVYLVVWIGIVLMQIVLGMYGGVFFSV